MKKIFVFLVTCLFISVCSTVYAHPPSDIIINFDPKTRILNAVIMHNVSIPSKHFIKKVDIALNGQEIITQTFNRQDNSNGQTVQYLIPNAKAGDVLSVEAYCSISGKLKKETKVSP